jgi:hypothetical protein
MATSVASIKVYNTKDCNLPTKCVIFCAILLRLHKFKRLMIVIFGLFIADAVIVVIALMSNSVYNFEP